MSSNSSTFNINISDNQIKKYNNEFKMISVKTIDFIFNTIISKLDKDEINYENNIIKYQCLRNKYIKKYNQICTK